MPYYDDDERQIAKKRCLATHPNAPRSAKNKKEENMSAIKCTTHNCENCNGCHCTAGIIQIDKHGVCKTKHKREYGALEQEKVNIEAAKDFDFDSGENTFIECDSTNCQYNHNNMCCSNIVNVCDGMFKTKCFTKNVCD